MGKLTIRKRPVLVRYGASIGAGTMTLPNVTIGSFAMAGAGAIVTQPPGTRKGHQYTSRTARPKMYWNPVWGTGNPLRVPGNATTHRKV